MVRITSCALSIDNSGRDTIQVIVLSHLSSLAFLLRLSPIARHIAEFRERERWRKNTVATSQIALLCFSTRIQFTPASYRYSHERPKRAGVSHKV